MDFIVMTEPCCRSIWHGSHCFPIVHIHSPSIQRMIICPGHLPSLTDKA